MISGHTRVYAHLGYPTETFKAPMIYNPFFEAKGIDAVVVPLGVRAEDFDALFRNLFRITTLHGALVSMPHKVTTLSLVDEASATARIAGACNAVRRTDEGRLAGDMFDGDGFVRSLQRKGRRIAGARALVIGAGGVGSAIAASLATAGLGAITLYDVNDATAETLAARLRAHLPALEIALGSNDPDGHDIVVNATPLGMRAGDPLPVDIARVAPSTIVCEVVLKAEYTPLLEAAQARGCAVQVGTDMLFEMIPLYMAFFGLGETTAEELRGLARIQY
jgi:shikimate dehydrogenase